MYRIFRDPVTRVKMNALSFVEHSKMSTSSGATGDKNDNRSIHSSNIKEVHNVPMQVIVRPIPPVLDELKVQSLMKAIKVISVSFYINYSRSSSTYLLSFPSRRLQTWVSFLPLMCCGLKVEKGAIITTRSEAVTVLLHIRDWTCPPFLPNSSGQMSLTSAPTWEDQRRTCGDVYAVFPLGKSTGLAVAVYTSYQQVATQLFAPECTVAFVI